MIFTDNFSDNNPDLLFPVFKQGDVPVFQNKVYSSSEEAVKSEKGRVELVQSAVSGFVFNKSFSQHIMDYDLHYQNEQGNSLVFKNHLNQVLQLLKRLGIENKKVVEIGCGKGGFFEMMLGEGIDCWGFDPTYEGNNERIKKEYFDKTQKGINADVIIMRHTLEHITHPFSFLHSIASANSYSGFLFVEVPTFDWIVNKNAFWDIFYEHCNYFTEKSLACIFEYAVTGNFFGGQYIYLWADLSKIRKTIPYGLDITKYDLCKFSELLYQYADILQNTKGSFAVWGAGAKGSTFLNLLDPANKRVKYVLDINPAKQNKFISGTGHPILNPEILLQEPVDNVLIMNENYSLEIKEFIEKNNIRANTISL